MKKNTPEQAHAIRLLMARIKRQQKSDCRCAHWFPAFVPGETKTRDYVRMFEHFCSLVPCTDFRRLGDRPAPFYVGPEIVAEQLELEAA